MKKPKEYPFDKEKTTVAVARNWVLSNDSDGVTCPCCRRYVKIYRRKLYSTMGAVLLHMYQENRNNKGVFLHIPSLLNGKGVAARGGDFSKLRLWDLIEPQQDKPAGFYRITKKGIEFAECRIAVPDAVYVYKGELLDWASTDLVTIADVLGNKFNYEDLMR